MPQRTNVVRALRYFRDHPTIPSRGIRYIARKLQETEEEDGQTQRYLKAAYSYLEKKRGSSGKSIMHNIKRLSGAYNAIDREG